jgi:hypothetical protein
MGKFTPHTILQRKGKRGSVVKGERRTRVTRIAEENMCDGDRRGELEKLWKHREF